MRRFKIYGTSYEIDDSLMGHVPDAYGYKDDLVYEEPPGKCVGFVQMEDGSVISCYKTFNPLVIIIPVAITFVIIIALLVYLIFLQPKDVVINGAPVKIGDDVNSVSYNGFMALRDGNITVDFQNGNQACTIQIIGDGIDSEVVNVDAGVYVATVPATFITDAGVINGKIVITTDTSQTENEVVIEIPENNTPNSTEASMEGYWDGEYIYGN